MRYLDAVRWLYRGDLATAQRYTPLARALLGQVVKETAESGVVSARRRFRIPDGVGTIEVVVAGLQTAVVVDVAPRSQQPVVPFEGFILTPSSPAYPPPNGLDASFPQVLLSPIRGAPNEYACWFSDAVTDASLIARIPRRYLPRAPEGFGQFGEIDWRGENGLSVSFHGPATRYFPRTYLPVEFRTKVYSCGQVLFDGEEYATRDGADPRCAWLIAGAAIFVEDEQPYLVCVHLDTTTMLDYPFFSRFSLLYGYLDPRVSSAAVITYPINLTTLETMDGHAVVSEFVTPSDAGPFHFSASGRRAIRVVTRHIGPVSEVFARDSIERIDDSWGYTIEDVAEYDNPPRIYWPDTSYATPYEKAVVAADFIGEQEAFLYFEGVAGAGVSGAYKLVFPDGKDFVVFTNQRSLLPFPPEIEPVAHYPQYVDIRHSMVAAYRLHRTIGTFEETNITVSCVVSAPGVEIESSRYTYASTNAEALGLAHYLGGDNMQSYYGWWGQYPADFFGAVALTTRGVLSARTGPNTVFRLHDLGPESLVNGRTREKPPRLYVGAWDYPDAFLGTWQWLDGRIAVSMTSLSEPYFNYLSGSTFARTTGVQGDGLSAFFPGSIIPRYLPPLEET